MQEFPVSADQDALKLLVRSVNWLGDAVMTSPALQRLRLRFPRAHITLLTQASLAPLWEGHPSIDAVLTLKQSESPSSIARRLRPLNFQTALILPNSPRSALETWLARIPHRIGYATPWRRWLLTRPVEHSPNRLRPRRLGVAEVKRLAHETHTSVSHAGARSYEHQMHDYLRLAAALGSDPTPLAPKLTVSQSEIETTLAHLHGVLTHRKVDGSPDPVFLGINVSAAYGPAKCWPVEGFAAAARQVAQSIPNCIWLNFGTETDLNLGERLAALAGGTILNLAGKTSLRQLMAHLQICRLLLTNDSGPMHVAAGLGTPVVALFGSTAPDLTAPGEAGDSRHHLLTGKAACSPCFRRTCPIDFRCMKAITVEQVVSAVLATLRPYNRALS